MTLELQAKRRDVFGKQVKKIIRSGLIPAVKYGNHKEPEHLQIPTKTLEKVYEKAGESTLVDLYVEGGAPVKVLIHELDRHPVTHVLRHADLLEVNMAEKITADVELKFVGESKAVKEMGGILVKNHTKVSIECLPQDLVQVIEVDIANLSAFGDHISISQLKVPHGVEIKEKADEMVVLVTEPRSEKELEELDQKVEEKIEDVEVEKKGKVEEEGEEGAEATEEAQPKEKTQQKQKKE